MGTRSVSAVHVDLTADPLAGYGVSEDGMVVATQESDGRVVVFLGLPTGRVERWEVPGVPAGSDPGRVSPDGRWLALPGTDGSVHVWDIAARTGPMRLTGPSVLRPTVTRCRSHRAVTASPGSRPTTEAHGNS